jgi:hypothetical protein
MYLIISILPFQPPYFLSIRLFARHKDDAKLDIPDFGIIPCDLLLDKMSVVIRPNTAFYTNG